MKVIDAFWEQRNLGVSCYELELSTSDFFDGIKSQVEGLEEREYMVVKIPSERYDFVQLFQNYGYTFIEAAITLEFNFKKYKCKIPVFPAVVQKVCEKCSWELMNKSDLEQLKNEVRKNIFSTDRIYIDPQFTHKQAAYRYELWIDDLVHAGKIPYKVVVDGKTVGFFLQDGQFGKTYKGILAATYDSYIGSGMGCCIQYAGLINAFNQGCHKYIGNVSGNNPDVLKILLLLGFSIKNIEYVFVKHKNKQKE